MCSFPKRGTSLFRRSTTEEMSVLVMRSGSTGKLFRRNDSFFGQHHGNVITHRVHPAASLTLQPGIVWQQVDRFDANRTAQNLEQFFGNGHASLRNRKPDSNKLAVTAATCRLVARASGRRSFGTVKKSRRDASSTTRTPYQKKKGESAFGWLALL